LVLRFSAFNLATNTFEGRLHDAPNSLIKIGGLWGLAFGGGNLNSGPSDSLYFTAGPNDESGGLFGNIRATNVTVPEPSTISLFGVGLLGLLRRRRTRA